MHRLISESSSVAANKQSSVNAITKCASRDVSLSSVYNNYMDLAGLLQHIVKSGIAPAYTNRMSWTAIGHFRLTFRQSEEAPDQHKWAIIKAEPL
jgi:hypothetical protein